MPNGVVFLPSYHEAIRELPDSDRLIMYDAIAYYGLYGEIIELPPVLKSMFSLIKPNIDASQNRYRAAKENGEKGGAPKGNQNAKKKQPENNQKDNQNNNQEKEIDSDKDFDKEPERDSKGETTFDRKKTGNDTNNMFIKMLEEKQEKFISENTREGDKSSKQWLEEMGGYGR